MLNGVVFYYFDSETGLPDLCIQVPYKEAYLVELIER